MLTWYSIIHYDYEAQTEDYRIFIQRVDPMFGFRLYIWSKTEYDDLGFAVIKHDEFYKTLHLAKVATARFLRGAK